LRYAAFYYQLSIGGRFVNIDQEQIDGLVNAPAESLNVEIKRWIGLTDPQHQAKIVKGCLALRNRNGGSLVIGFDDETLQPDRAGAPSSPRDDFHVDKVQGLISRFSQEIFEVGVGFSHRDGLDYPVIVVPPGVQVPVAAKRELKDGFGKQLVVEGGIYFRTLNANGVPSTSLAHPKDWREIVEICFENREADIARFLRRHLSGIDYKSLVNGLSTMSRPEIVSAPVSRDLQEECNELLKEGEMRFRKALESKRVADETFIMADLLSMQVALVVDPSLPNRSPDAGFLSEALGSNPRYTGWPTWADSRGFTEVSNRPYVINNGWESLIYSPHGWSSHLDFWRIEPNRFYLRRALQDDLTDKVRQGTALDPILVILRVAEAIAVGAAMVKSLAPEENLAGLRIGFAFKWTKLANRSLSTWANPMVMMIGSPQSQQDEVFSYVEMAADTPLKSIAPIVDEATKSLFVIFEGERIPTNVIEQWTDKLINRKL
jgi:hypothetical protein